MSDNRVRIETKKSVNLAQLDAELGGHGLSQSEHEIVANYESPVTHEQLDAAIKAHVATYPEKEAQAAAIAHAKSLGFTDAMIAVMYPNLGAQSE
jgi:uncharacterized membrane protein